MDVNSGIYEEFYEFERNRPTNFSERRKECLLGELPEDFLRVHPHATQLPPHHSLPPGTPTGAVAHPGFSYPLPTMSYPSQKSTFLDVTVIEARLNKNYGITRMDTFCSVRVGHNYYETPTHYSSGKSPCWNKTFACPLAKGIDSIYVQVYEERMLGNNCIGWVIIPIPETVREGVPFNGQFSLTGKQKDKSEGSVSLILSCSTRDIPSYMAWSGMPASYSPVAIMPPTSPYNPIYRPMPVRSEALPPVPVPVRDEDVAALQEMFPERSCDAITRALQQSRGNKEAAINILLQ